MILLIESFYIDIVLLTKGDGYGFWREFSFHNTLHYSHFFTFKRWVEWKFTHLWVCVDFLYTRTVIVWFNDTNFLIEKFVFLFHLSCEFDRWHHWLVLLSTYHNGFNYPLLFIKWPHFQGNQISTLHSSDKLCKMTLLFP